MGSSHSKEEALMGVEKVKPLGRGAFGEAFLVKKNSQLLVMKKINVKNMDPKLVKYQLQEAELLRSIQHPNIVSYKAHAFKDDMVCILLEYCEGGDLLQEIKRQAETKRPFAEETVSEWIRQLASGLKYIHAIRIIHRDVKPNNIFLSSNRKTLKIGDFGVSKLLPDGSLFTSTMLGTPVYMGPEVLQGSRYGAKADMYSLGASIFHVATFSYPQPHKEVPVVYSVRLRHLIAVLMSQRPEDRPSANDTLDYLAGHTFNHGLQLL
ncbi:Serine/threonine-protein kinase Nek6 [Chionoecetes opilio]|uniref:non-specific serine/threonine protein kinase n=1 Tax=Chionoecetes opilio TaxID=41210 RepID=A0A8J4YB96_CHIOP|nr:Serine/threonine-protein kinase Nek6 [Chionoecetes opilio]